MCGTQRDSDFSQERSLWDGSQAICVEDELKHTAYLCSALCDTCQDHQSQEPFQRTHDFVKRGKDTEGPKFKVRQK